MAQKKRSAPTTEEVMEQVAADVIGLLDRREVVADDFRGVVKNPSLTIPRNAVTQRPYTGFNAIRAMIAMLDKGTMDGRFCTVNQAREYSGEKVFPAKGSSATRLMRPIILSSKDPGDSDPVQEAKAPRKLTPMEISAGDDGAPGEQRSVVGFKPFPIFHVGELQISELEPFDPPPLEETGSITSHELVSHFIAAAGAKIEPGASPCFIPGTKSRPDGVISMPLASDHCSPDSWAADALHEFYHWTGVPGRQNRFDYLEEGLSATEALQRFDDGYAVEEVRAELFATLASRVLGLDYDIRQHVSYIDFWSGKAIPAPLGGDNSEDHDRAKLIRSVLQDVAPIVTGLQRFMIGEEPDLKWFPSQGEWPDATRDYFIRLADPVDTSAKLDSNLDEPEASLNIPPALAASFGDEGRSAGATPHVEHEAKAVEGVRQPQGSTINIDRHATPWGRVNTVKGPAPGL